ncbi:MAG: MATE family efflux transporter [Candidatus Eisenbacteria bacterium]|nr:MATE family efflux transporter [Candidatus Eisenbacteria bacterium]
MSRNVESDGLEARSRGGTPRDHVLSDTDIGALLWRLSIPATIGMVVMATYNLVDAIFIGRGVGPLGIGGLAICFPVQLLVMSIGTLLGVGGASIISRALGAGNEARAHNTLGNVLTLVLIISGAIMAVGFSSIEQVLTLFGATEELLPYSRRYLSVILWGTVFRCYVMSHHNIVRSEGRARVAMTSMLIGALLNIALDPIFIFGLDMGLRGAALATVIAQAASTVFLALYFATGRSGLSMGFADLRLRWSIVRETLAVGASSFGRMAAGSVVLVVLNRSLAYYGGNMAIAGYGIVNRLLHFLFMPVIGFGQGLQPVAGFNYGARRFDLAKLALRISTIRSTVFVASAFVVLYVFARPLVGFFTDDRELIELTADALRIISLAFPLIGIQMMGTVTFQAFGRAGPAVFLSLSRQIILLIPLVLILPRFLGLDGIFWAFPAADTTATAVTVAMLLREFARLRRLDAAASA